MFSKTKKEVNGSAGPAAPVKPAVPSIISTDMKIIGDIVSDGEIQIDGSVEGDIRAKTLLIGEPAHIKGEVVAEVIEVFGSINGQIKATQVSLAKTAHMIGDILHENLSIEKGAFLEGHCKRMPDKKEINERISLVHDNGTGPAAPADKTAPAPVKGGDPDKRANSN